LKRIVGGENVTINERTFKGIFQAGGHARRFDYEALAQAGGLLLLLKFRIATIASVSRGCGWVRFRRPVVPGDQ